MNAPSDPPDPATRPAGPVDPGGGPEPAVTVEVERTFEPGPAFRLPDLAGVPGVAAVSGPVVHALEATYFDTADLRLATHRITLRRRTGGDDAGWHLKRPRRDGERDELRVPLGESETVVPGAVRGPVEGLLRHADLRPVVRLSTTRTVRTLRDDRGAVLAEVADDDVRATRLGDGGAQERVSRWRELEVELVDGDRELLAEVSRRLVVAGAPLSASTSKFARALGRQLGT
ncbi:MAG TPA: CYTH domain-containing protein [Kineosporiaceae bacterium]